MSDRFGIPGHAPQHAPDHAPLNPTPQGNWDSNFDTPAPQPQSSAYYSSSGSGGDGYVDMRTPPPPRKSYSIAVVLAMLIGPFGLFYVGLLNGIAALIVLPAVAPLLRDALLPLVGTIARDAHDIVIVGMAWALCIPLAVVGVWWRNRAAERKFKLLREASGASSQG